MLGWFVCEAKPSSTEPVSDGRKVEELHHLMKYCGASRVWREEGALVSFLRVQKRGWRTEVIPKGDPER